MGEGHRDPAVVVGQRPDALICSASRETVPALKTDGDPTAGGEADASLLGTAERTDGSTQVTYNGLPLYYFANDEAAGDTNGQGLNEVWWVVSPQGEPVME